MNRLNQGAGMSTKVYFNHQFPFLYTKKSRQTESKLYAQIIPFN